MSSASGKFILRLEPPLHASLVRRAQSEGLSLNRLCTRLLENSLSARSCGEAEWLVAARRTVPKLRKHFQERLLGVAVFGSRVTGDDTRSSDIDVLVLLKPGTSVDRSLYAWWDEHTAAGRLMLNPQFLVLPKNRSATGGIWFEIALHHVILFDPRSRLARLMKKLNALQEKGSVTRAWSNGHPYWIWRDSHEKQVAQS